MTQKSTRKEGTIDVRLEYRGRGKPIPVESPYAEDEALLREKSQALFFPRLVRSFNQVLKVIAERPDYLTDGTNETLDALEEDLTDLIVIYSERKNRIGVSSEAQDCYDMLTRQGFDRASFISTPEATTDLHIVEYARREGFLDRQDFDMRQFIKDVKAHYRSDG